MTDSETKKTAVEQAAADLLDFAIDREDIKWLMAQLSDASQVNRTTVEYELQLLKIIAVGWGISYFLEGVPDKKTELAQRFWQAVNEFSHSLSETTGLMIGQDIDYFEILKTRLEAYVKGMQAHAQSSSEPTAVIGPLFAAQCGDEQDLFASLTGTKMFSTTIQRVRQYLEALGFLQP